MSHVVDTFRKHQKLFVLGIALAVITLYMVPVDQLVQGLSPRAQALDDRFEAIKARLVEAGVDTSSIEQAQYRIVNFLNDRNL